MEWIKVEDRFPEDSTEGLLVYAPLFGIKIFEASFYKDKFCTPQGLPYKDKDQKFFTNWMPLPEPPKEP